MSGHERFQWHANKARDNLRKHRVAFDVAAQILSDPSGDLLHREVFDEAHSENDEDRWITTGSIPTDRYIILRVSWSRRYDENGTVTRIISARHVTPRERREYEKEIS